VGPHLPTSTGAHYFSRANLPGMEYNLPSSLSPVMSNMRRRLTIKHHQGEIQLFSRRVIVCAVLIFLFVGALIGRLIYLQVFQHEFLSLLSEQNLMTIVPTEPNRGLIYDRNGVLLAKNTPSFNLTVNPSKVRNLWDTIERLQTILLITPHDIDM